MPKERAKPSGTGGRGGRSNQERIQGQVCFQPQMMTQHLGHETKAETLPALPAGHLQLPPPSPPPRQGRESAGRGWRGAPRGLTSCSIAGSLPRGAGKHEACSIQNVFERDGLEPFTNTPLYSLLIQTQAARSELHGQAFSPALFYKVGSAGLDAGGGGGEREKKRNRGKEGTPAGWAEGEAEAKLGSGAAAPARACGRARVTGRTRVPRPPAAAAAAARSAPGSALARPRRGAGAMGAAPAAVRPGVFVRSPRSAPLRMSLCGAPGQALRAPRRVGHGLGRPPRLSRFWARSSLPRPAPFPPFGTPSPASHPPPSRLRSPRRTLS